MFYLNCCRYTRFNFLWIDDRVSLDLGKTIMKARQEKQISQKDLGVVSIIYKNR